MAATFINDDEKVIEMRFKFVNCGKMLFTIILKSRIDDKWVETVYENGAIEKKRTYSAYFYKDVIKDTDTLITHPDIKKLCQCLILSSSLNVCAKSTDGNNGNGTISLPKIVFVRPPEYYTILTSFPGSFSDVFN